MKYLSINRTPTHGQVCICKTPELNSFGYSVLKYVSGMGYMDSDNKDVTKYVKGWIAIDRDGVPFDPSRKVEKVYRFTWKLGKYGKLSSILLAEPSVIKEAIGKRVDFGTPEGFPRSITGTLEDEDFEVVTDNYFEVEVFRDAPIPKGLNPLDHIVEQDF